MSKEFETQKVEDCFDGSSIFEYKVYKEIKEEFIIKLNIFGKLYYYKEFPRPFFKIKIQNGSEILGVQGECSFRVVYCKKCKEIYKDFFENDLEIILNDIKK